MSLSPSVAQRGVLIGMLTGVVMTLLLVWVGCGLNPWQLGPREALEARTWLAAVSLLAPTGCLLACIARLAKHRFFTPEDIDGSGLTQGTHQAKLLQSLLQNTLEQLALAVPSYVGAALLLPGDCLSLVPLASGAFVMGRVLFFFRYSRGAAARSLGFALTFYPTAAVLLSAAISGATG